MPVSTKSSLALVAIGGAIGALLRWIAGELWPGDATGFPWVTLLVNLLGATLLGALSVRVISDRWRLLLGPGVLGGFTTLSAYADQSRALATDGHLGLAGAYLIVTLVACVAGVGLGRWLGNSQPTDLDSRAGGS